MFSKKLSVALLFMVVTLTLASHVQAQQPEPVVVQQLTTSQTLELEKWMKDDTKYLEWYKENGGRALTKKSLFKGETLAKIRERPDPPVWLAEKCAEKLLVQDLLVSACRLLKEQVEDPIGSKIRGANRVTKVTSDQPARTRFIERVHLGGGWPIVSESRLMKYQAIIETHVSVANVGRLEVNLPGIMFISMPNLQGNRTLKAATHIGAGVRLWTFGVPGVKSQRFVLHFNWTTAWLLDGTSLPGQKPLSLVGLSATVKK